VIDNAAAKYRLIILNEPELAGVSELYRLVLRPGGVLDSKPHERGAVEQLTVLSGEVEVRCGSDRLRLQPGRTARYAADVAHAIASVGKRNAEALLLVRFAKSK
jgi:mannose-6-phosphate isomerase-like protein (cupin superfamily)